MSTASNGPQPPDKRITCHDWTRDTCQHQHAPSKCKNAHHFFPVISERISPIVDKLKIVQECRNCLDPDRNSQWPADTCSWSHVVISRAEDKKQNMVLDLIKKRPWTAVLMYRCVVADCQEPDQEYASIEQVLKHCRAKHGQPLDDSGSWKGEREPIREED